jgi:hypothetical protein
MLDPSCAEVRIRTLVILMHLALGEEPFLPLFGELPDDLAVLGRDEATGIGSRIGLAGCSLQALLSRPVKVVALTLYSDTTKDSGFLKPPRCRTCSLTPAK